jgi:hypothetical protein
MQNQLFEAALGISQIGYVHLVGNKKLAVARVERANVDLQDNVSSLHDRLAVAARSCGGRGSNISAGK